MVEMRTFSVSGLFFAVFLVSTEASNNVISTVPEAVINLNFTNALEENITVPSAGHDKQNSGNVHWTYWKEMNDVRDAELTETDWAKIYPRCSGRRQSPIMLSTKTAFKDPALKSLTLIDYDDTPAGDLWSVINNGHAVQLSGYFRTPPQMQGANLPGKYVFQQLHFHWGSNSSIGSEHRLDGKAYPLELHLVHRRKNDTDEEAVNDEVGLAVIGVMFEVASTRQQPNRHMEDIIAAIRKVTTPGKAVNATMPYFSLSELMPENPSYMRYLGSLTTPPCYEAVFWTVMTTPLKITETQLEVFRSLLKAQDSAGEKKLELIGRRSEAVRRDLRLMDNFRPLQPSNERNVTFYEAPTDSNSILTTTAAPNPTANVKLQRMQLPMITESTWTWAGTTNATSHHGGPTTPTTRTAGETSSKGKQRNSADQPRSSRFALAVLFTVWLKSLGLS